MPDKVLKEIPVVDPAKIRQHRGKRSRREIVEASNGAISEMQLKHWEDRRNKPRPESIPGLLEGLGVDFADIVSDINEIGKLK